MASQSCLVSSVASLHICPVHLPCQRTASASQPTRPSLAVRAAAEGPVRKPAVPTAPSPPSPSAPTTSTDASPSSSTPSSATSSSAKPAVSLEYQRQAAKELIAYFQEKKFEEDVARGQVLGWTRKNEIGNGRWVMFGLAVGLLTEYATGVNFPDQIGIVLANLGIID